ncbi:DUF2931 family protein [Apirhabdus apintestini]|uniref:DUF2931 family protein n=1 Tax=Erwinia sp. HR93 TaxID=3094840 RepID=UPI002ADECA46|nr:DUF2931 family protein [Erwinia sp. HR93]MEA1064025.1 DUF2931 family protein [Erwinia sp. HR93]WPM84393.1 DUF2931 family protein [Enterobacteriaceae bacterium CA-0114]
MEMIRVAWLLPLLALAACQGKPLPGTAAQSDMPKEWWFNFFTPKTLPAIATFAVVQDADGKVYEFNTLDSTKALNGVMDKWNDNARTLNGHWNHVRRPPRHIIFCWDSVIDKKVYETALTIPRPLLDKMLMPGHKDHQGNEKYYNAIQIGLAPEGKVTVWLSGVSRGEPNYRITPSVLKTVSGDKLELCKGVTRFSNGYEYGKNTEDFIKGKKYPYGSW